MIAINGDVCVGVGFVRRWARAVKGKKPATMNLYDRARTEGLIATTDTQQQTRVDKFVVNPLEIVEERQYYQLLSHYCNLPEIFVRLLLVRDSSSR